MQLHLQCLPVKVEGTVIRRMSEADLPIFHAYRSDPELAQYQGWSAMSEQQCLEFILSVKGVDALQLGGWIQLAIADEATDRLLGDLGLFVDEEEQVAEVGFTLCRTAQGVGHATRTVRAATEMLFAITAVSLIRGVIDARNIQSIGVLERAGFHKSREQTAIFKGEECQELVFVLARGST